MTNRPVNYFIIIFSLTLNLAFPFLIFAQSEIAQTEEIEIDETLIKEKVKERLEQSVMGETDTQSQETSKSQEPAVQWFSAFGNVSEVTNSNFLITSQNNTRTTIYLDKDTDLNLQSDKTSKSIDLDKIEQDWFAIAMGPYAEGTENINAKRITFSTTPPQSIKRQILIGKIIEIDTKSLSLQNDKVIEISIPQFINLKIKGMDKAELNDINPDDKAVVVVQIEEKKPKTNKSEENTEITYSLKAIYITPNIKNPLSVENATDSAVPAQSEPE